MADIFISYARDDVADIEPLIAQLEANGYSVWWDKHLSGGARYANVIEAEITKSKHVIVVWSRASVESQWVTDEATLGRDLKKLIPIVLDDIKPPIGFRQLQALNFRSWDRDSNNESFKELLRSLGTKPTDIYTAELISPGANRSMTAINKKLVRVGAISIAAIIGVVFALFQFSPLGDGSEKSAGSLVEGLDPRASIAVLPFEESGITEEESYFSEGITIDIITRLQSLRLFPVISKKSSFSFQDQSLDAREISHALGASYIVEGTVRRYDDQIRVTAQLIEAESGYAIWSETYDRPSGEIFKLQDDITLSIAAAILPEVKRSEMVKARTRPAANPTAYDLYLQGLRLSRAENFEEAQRARAILEQAVETDPTFAAPYVELAWIEHDRITYYTSQTTWDQSVAARDQALSYARTAISLDPLLAEAHTVYGHMLLHYQRSDEGIAALTRAIELNPSSADNRANYAWGLVSNGFYQQAITEYKKAQQLNPNDPKIWEVYQNIGYAELLSGNYERAISSTQEGLLINPDNFYSYLTLICAYNKLGKRQKAEAAFERFVELAPGFSTKSLDLTSFSSETTRIFKEALFEHGWVDAY